MMVFLLQGKFADQQKDGEYYKLRHRVKAGVIEQLCRPSSLVLMFE
jgi:hypothetical protein